MGLDYCIIIYLRASVTVCHFKRVAHNYCGYYGSDLIAGHLCPYTCNFKNCLEHTKGDSKVNIYHEGLFDIRLSNDENLFLASYFAYPTNDYDVKLFRLNLGVLLRGHGLLHVDRIMSSLLGLADIDNNGNLTANEARSLWALVRDYNFVLLILLSELPSVAKINSFCGNLYSFKNLKWTFMKNHFHSNGKSTNVVIKSESDSWFARLRVAEAYLEFMDELADFKNQYGPEMKICSDIDPHVVMGQSGEIYIMELSFLAPVSRINNTSLYNYYEKKPSQVIHNNISCYFRCPKGRICHAKEFIPPNLMRFCDFISKLLYKGAPKTFWLQMNKYLNDCFSIDFTDQFSERSENVVKSYIQTLFLKYMLYSKSKH